MTREYIVLCGQVVGGGNSAFEVVYGFDDKRFNTRDDAIAHGFRERGSDDFNIGILKNGKLAEIVWMDESADKNPSELNEIAKGLSSLARMTEGKHGHYETMFRVVREEVEAAERVRWGLITDLLNAFKELLPHVALARMTDDELREEDRLGNGFAILILNARAAIAKAERLVKELAAKEG